jgi:eukaryotic-like serine/threonine-protein kinase
MTKATPLIPPPVREIRTGEHSRIVVGQQIGRGMIATVYRGTMTGRYGVEREVALKIFDVVASDEYEPVLETLVAAAREAACVRHPNVVDVYDFGVCEPSQPYCVMELVEGRSLAEFVNAYATTRQRIPLDLALFIGIEVAEALAGARIACTPGGVPLGVTHGELSTSEVILSWNGEVKVTDFRIAAATRAASGVRSMRSLARRIRALAPEVARGQSGDARSDVFSLGVLLREMLLGPRFPANITDAEALADARAGIVHSTVFEPQLVPELAAILHRALEKEPPKRYPHSGVLAYELRRVALAMGVGDGRIFLRHAMPEVFAAADGEDEATRDFGRRPSPVPPDIVERYSRNLAHEDRADAGVEEPRESGLMRAAAARERFDSDTNEYRREDLDDEDLY